ncbi:hypothetical protein THIOM_003667, partial [Candidatus Thiomargarita nelsonii]
AVDDEMGINEVYDFKAQKKTLHFFIFKVTWHTLEVVSLPHKKKWTLKYCK